MIPNLVEALSRQELIQGAPMSPKKLVLQRENLVDIGPAQRIWAGLYRGDNNTDTCSYTCGQCTIEFTYAAATCNQTQTCQNCGFEPTQRSCDCPPTGYTWRDPVVCTSRKKDTH